MTSDEFSLIVGEEMLHQEAFFHERLDREVFCTLVEHAFVSQIDEDFHLTSTERVIVLSLEPLIHLLDNTREERDLPVSPFDFHHHQQKLSEVSRSRDVPLKFIDFPIVGHYWSAWQAGEKHWTATEQKQAGLYDDSRGTSVNLASFTLVGRTPIYPKK